MSTSKQAIEIKPTTFARGVPKEEHNGLFGEGIAERLLDMPIGTQFTAVVTYTLDDDVVKRGKAIRYPVVALSHIEPIWDEELIDQAKEVQEAAYKERTGANQLDFGTEDDEK